MSRRKTPQANESINESENVSKTKETTTSKKPNKRIRQRELMVRIRAGAGVNYQHVDNQFLGEGTFEIDEIAPGPGSATGWGHLVNGKGWVALDFVEILD